MPSPSQSSSRRRRTVAPSRCCRRRRRRPGPWPSAGPVGAPRAVMNIKHPCKPKPVCCCIPITILLQDAGIARFKMCSHNPGIYQVYTRLRKCRLGKDILGISRRPDIFLLLGKAWNRYIPGIYLGYENGCHMTGPIPGISLGYDIHGHNPGIMMIYQVYTTKFPSMGIPDVRYRSHGLRSYRSNMMDRDSSGCIRHGIYSSGTPILGNFVVYTWYIPGL
jgi:hypothetical protein